MASADGGSVSTRRSVSRQVGRAQVFSPLDFPFTVTYTVLDFEVASVVLPWESTVW